MPIKTKPLPQFSEADKAAFWKRVDKRGDNECWPWKGSKTGNVIGKKMRMPSERYGRFSRKGLGNFRAHRVALFLKTGKDPGDLLACHSCDNTLCCNWNHVFAGTAQDNSDDCVAKKRIATGDNATPRKYPESRKRGEANPASKATAEIVQRILKIGADAVLAGKLRSLKRLPVGFLKHLKCCNPDIDLSIPNIAWILKGNGWRHISRPPILKALMQPPKNWELYT